MDRGQDRFSLLERRVDLLEQQLRRAQRLGAMPPPAPVARPRVEPKPAPVAPAPTPRVEAPAPIQVERPALEDFLGGRVLGWAGAVAVLLGVAFLVAVAIGRGWIDEPARIALAFAGSAALLAVGAWLHERRGATQASLAIAGTGLAGLFLALVAGAQLYHLYPAPMALAGALVIGLAGTVLALRWNSRTLAALAIGGALLAPPLVGAALTDLVMAVLLMAFGCAAAILVNRRWDWLAVGCFTVTAPQLLVWVYAEPRPVALLAGLTAFALVNAAAALGFELRVKDGPSGSSTLLVLGGALVAAGAGYYGLHEAGQGALADWWLAALALVHLAAGACAIVSRRVHTSTGIVTAGAGIVLADLAFGALASGPVLVVGWASTTVALALLARGDSKPARQATLVAAASQLTLALAHVLAFDAAPAGLGHPIDDLAAALAGIGAVGVSAFVCARVLERDEATTAFGLDAIALAALAYAEAHAFHGPPLVAALAGTAVAAAGAIKREPLARGAAIAFLGLAAAITLGAHAVPTRALTFGVEDIVGAAVALGAVAAACFATARLLRTDALAFNAVGAVALLYLASTAIVTGFQPSADSLDAGLALGVRQQGQVLLSGLWAIVGATALVSGLRRDRLELRAAGFGLLALAFGKVIVFDLSTLDSIYRVASCVALGLLLLGSAFAYQRLRPRPRVTRA
jgi:uncharacterized membrane protein